MGKEQIAILDPNTELRFQGPFDQVVTSLLKLKNPSEKKICFKVKTTAPKQYCVRPNSGFISPGKSVEVHVMLQPFKHDPNEKNKHKFMVQTMYAPDGDEEADALWKTADPSQVVDAKLKCVFARNGSESAVGDGTSAPAVVTEREPEPRLASTAEASAAPAMVDDMSCPADVHTPAVSMSSASPAPSEVKKTVKIVEPELTSKMEPAAQVTYTSESTVRQRHVPEATSSQPSVTPVATPPSTHRVESPKLNTATPNAAFPMPAVLAIIALAVLAWVLGQYLF